jgi:hypothetical protein
MLHYHGMSGMNDGVAVAAVGAGHGLISFAYPEPLGAAIEICQSFALDNGAYSAWKCGREIEWAQFYQWVDQARFFPNFDFAVIPDRITGTELENDRLLDQWPWQRDQFLGVGAPVWHPHESTSRLERLVNHWPRLCIGGSPDFRIGSDRWWNRMAEAMDVLCDDRGRPKVKIHGLRLLDPEIFKKLPLASADSTNISRNIKYDDKWSKGYRPLSYETRAKVLRERIEIHQSSPIWERRPIQAPLIS